ncbi:MAG: hypothetical protein QF844_11080, partial [Acidimicrobiales bacterium]|nr:hypothetical protein [Acidimicrobiales bacterium]
MMFLPVGPTLGGVNTSMLHMASPSFREKIGFPPGDAGGPLLWHVDSPSGDGRVSDRLCKMLVDSEDAPRADTLWAAVHFNTKDVSAAELALGRLAAAGVVLQWPRPELSSAPPPSPVRVRRDGDFCTTGRFLLYLPPAHVRAMSKPVSEPTDPVMNAILSWVHNSYNGTPSWATDEAGVEYVIEPCVGGAMSQRQLFMQINAASALAQLALFFELPETEVSKRAVILPVQGYPSKPRAIRRCSGKASCWALFWRVDDAVSFACRSSAAQVQGQSPNGGYASCFTAASDGGRSHLPGRMTANAGPALVIQQPVRFILGNFIEKNSHHAETATEMIACKFGHVVPVDYLPPGCETGEEFLRRRVVAHPAGRPEALKVLGMAVLLDWSSPGERFIADVFYDLSMRRELGAGLKGAVIFWRLEDCKCDAHLGRGQLRCFVGHQLCQAAGSAPMQCNLCSAPGHGRNQCSIAASRPKFGG